MISKELIAAQVQQVRTDAEIFLFDTVYIKRFIGKTVARGEAIIIYSEPIAVKCRIINRSGDDNTPVASQFRAIQQKTNISLLRIQLSFDTDVQLQDVFIINDHEYTPVYVPEKHQLMGAFIVFLEKRA
jgi:hypothetical protein